MKKILCAVILIILYSPNGFATPEIQGVSGTVTHEGTITITSTDTNFGTKSPAAPLLWDACKTNPALSTYYDEYIPGIGGDAQQGSQYNIGYRDSTFLDGRDSLGLPHDNTSYALGGAHATSSSGYHTGGTVGIGVNTPTNPTQWFAIYWYAIDPIFPDCTSCGAADNMKEIDLSTVAGSFYETSATHGFLDWCNADVPNVNQTSDPKMQRVGCEDGIGYSCSGNYLVTHNTPLGAWIKMQWEGDYNVGNDCATLRFTTFPDNNVTYRTHYNTEIVPYRYASPQHFGYPKTGTIAHIGIGGYSVTPRTSNGINAYRYFSCVYVDVTHARVMLGDNEDYTLCTKMEPQIPSEWSTSEIKATVNLGDFADSGPAYLFVFDSDNDANAEGYPVTLGGTNSTFKGVTISGGGV